jgi:hypothetical protein
MRIQRGEHSLLAGMRGIKKGNPSLFDVSSVSIKCFFRDGSNTLLGYLGIHCTII